MARNIQMNASDLTGTHIYHQKNQTIYYNSITRKGYVITNSAARTFSTWQMRLPLSVIAACILILMQAEPLGAILIGFAAYLASTLYFINRYLPTLPVLSSFRKPPSKGLIRDLACRYTITTLGFVILMFYGMAAIIAVNTFLISKVEGQALSISIVFIVIAILAGSFFLLVRQIKVKENL